MQSRDLVNHPFEKNKRHGYIKIRNEYKKACRKAEKEARKELTKKVLNIGLNDPKGFWNVINKMNNWGREKQDESDQISPSAWKDYFTKLLNCTSNNSLPDNDSNEDRVPTFDPMLDRTITIAEGRKALLLLKNH